METADPFAALRDDSKVSGDRVDIGNTLLSATGFVLAGGRSSRMGTDKALLAFRGEPLILHALRVLRTVCPDVAIAGGTPALSAYGPVVADEIAFQGPLGGIVGGLRHTSSEWNLFLPIDTPFLPADALRTLLAAPRSPETVAILTRTASHTNPLIGLYRRSALAALEAELAAGNLRVRAAVESSGPVAYADFAEPEQQAWFRNLNTPGDLAEAEKLPSPQGR